MKKKLISILLGVMLFVPGIVNAATYEYIVVRFKGAIMKPFQLTEKKQTKALNEYAKKGWKLVHIVEHGEAAIFFYFEREVTEPNIWVRRGMTNER